MVTRAIGEIQISALPEAVTPISVTDITNIKQGVSDKKVTIDDLLAPHASKTGNVHRLVPSDINLGNVKDYPITDAVNDKSSDKYASAMAVALVSERLDNMFPVNHVMMSLNAANPSTYGYVGTWSFLGKGHTLIGFDADKPEIPVRTVLGADEKRITVANLPSHNFKVNGSVVAAGDHSHSINLNTASDGAHTHSINFNTSGAGDHSHTVNINTNAAGDHIHSLGGSSSSAGDHAHYCFTANPNNYGNATNSGSRTAATGVKRVWTDRDDYMLLESWGGGDVGLTSTNGGHNHNISGTANTSGSHAHNINGNTGGVGGHVHSINGTTSQVASHTHSVNGNTANTAAHTHQIDLTTSPIGSDTPINVMQKSMVVYIWTRTS